MNDADKLSIRAAQGFDVRAIKLMEMSVAEAPHWPEAEYARLCVQTSDEPEVARVLLVCESRAGDGVEDPGEIVGFMAGSLNRWQDGTATAELESVVVQMGARRAGLGRALCGRLVEWASEQGAEKILLEVRAKSVGAQALYLELGFSVTGRRPDYYWEPVDDALLMELLI